MIGDTEIPTAKQTPYPEASQQECPKCHAVIPVYPDYVTWCDKCGWNLKAHKPERPRTLFESLYASMGARLSRKLLADLSKKERLAARLTGVKVAAFLAAGLVHALTLLIALLGVMLLVVAHTSLIGIVAGVLCLGIAWVIRPRVPRLDKEDVVVPREEFPTLYALTDQVSHALGTSPISGIIIDERFNAAFAQVGWRRKKVLFLGLPLLSVIGPQEFVALVGHEVAHGANRDPVRSFFVGTAISTLSTWYYLLHPHKVWGQSYGWSSRAQYNLLAIPGNLVMLFFASIVKAWTYVMYNLLWRDSQRAEYLADAMGAQVAGTSATFSMLEKLHLGDTFLFTLKRVSLNSRKVGLFEELRSRAEHVPPREVERIRRVEQMENSRLDSTHPPTAYRLDALRARSVTAPQVTLGEARYAQLQAELATVQEKIQQELLDKHEDSLYY